MGKPGSWFLLVKLVKNTCGGMTFSVKMQVIDRYFLHVVFVKTNYLASAQVEHWSKMGYRNSAVLNALANRFITN